MNVATWGPLLTDLYRRGKIPRASVSSNHEADQQLSLSLSACFLCPHTVPKLKSLSSQVPQNKMKGLGYSCIKSCIFQIPLFKLSESQSLLGDGLTLLRLSYSLCLPAHTFNDVDSTEFL